MPCVLSCACAFKKKTKERNDENDDNNDDDDINTPHNKTNSIPRNQGRDNDEAFHDNANNEKTTIMTKTTIASISHFCSRGC